MYTHVHVQNACKPNPKTPLHFFNRSGEILFGSKDHPSWAAEVFFGQNLICKSKGAVGEMGLKVRVGDVLTTVNASK
jgi:hypothetical protein